MSKATWISGLLALALLITNACWAYQAIDSGVTATHQEESFRFHRGALVQALAILPVAADVDSTPDQVVAAAQQAGSHLEPFVKEGFTWVGFLGLRFDNEGRLVGATSSAIF